MPEERVEVISEKRVATAVQLLIMVALAALFPLFPLQQITGPLVNALLFVATIMLGVRNALLICFLPSIMAYSVGTLPFFMWPMIPVIILSNILLVLLFSKLQKKNYWLGVVVASFVKFVFIYSVATLLASEFIKNPMFVKVAGLMMGYMQLVSAVVGGIIAWVFLKSIKRI